ncbi:MAG: prepilin-type N-terminal cleavage/methylation domain-containing protein [Acidobacteria bacterium]|nr:prepilin-type N-terminal cleavage/methylation domain-containing protein [Acidobacteriota bacterium]
MNRRTEKGFSLVELLVATVVGGIIMAGIYSAFMSSLNVFSSQQEISQMQFNAKAVTSFLKEKLANAGSGVPADVPIPPIAFLNNASTVSTTKYLNGADAIQIRMYGNVGEAMIIKNYNEHAANLRLEQPNPVDVNPVNNQNTSVGNLLLVWSPGTTNYALVEITSVAEVATGGSGTGNDTQVNFSPGLSIYNYPGGLGGAYSGGLAMMIDQSAMSTFTFFVDTNRVLRMADGAFDLQNPTASTNVAALPLLDNVEDFQIQIGYDTNADNIVDNWSWTYDPVANNPNINQALVLRCYLLCRSQRTERFVNNVQRPDIDPADGVSYAGAPDNVRRRMYSFTIQLRNRLN